MAIYLIVLLSSTSILKSTHPQKSPNMTLLASGTIKGPEAGGAVSIVKTEDDLKLILTDYWIAPGAPDVRIYLSPHATGQVDDAVDLGPMHQLEGTIELALSHNTRPETIKSVVVYCKVFSVTFGVGVLEHVRAQG